jgi:hypothetical protein
LVFACANMKEEISLGKWRLYQLQTRLNLSSVLTRLQR